MAKLYESEAEVVIDGTATPTYVRFGVYTEDMFKTWHGLLAVDDFQLALTAIEADEVLLRMPDGKEGRVVVTDAPSGPGEGIGFTGSGPAPV